MRMVRQLIWTVTFVLVAATLDEEIEAVFAHLPESEVLAPIAGRVSRHLVSVGNLVQGSESGATLLTSIVSLDPIHVYFDMDESIYQRNSKLWFEGKRPSSRDTPNPVQITLSGDTKQTHQGKMDFLDNRLDVSTGTLRGAPLVVGMMQYEHGSAQPVCTRRVKAVRPATPGSIAAPHGPSPMAAGTRVRGISRGLSSLGTTRTTFGSCASSSGRRVA